MQPSSQFSLGPISLLRIPLSLEPLDRNSSAWGGSRKTSQNSNYAWNVLVMMSCYALRLLAAERAPSWGNGYRGCDVIDLGSLSCWAEYIMRLSDLKRKVTRSVPRSVITWYPSLGDLSQHLDASIYIYHAVCTPRPSKTMPSSFLQHQPSLTTSHTRSGPWGT